MQAKLRSLYVDFVASGRAALRKGDEIGADSRSQISDLFPKGESRSMVGGDLFVCRLLQRFPREEHRIRKLKLGPSTPPKLPLCKRPTGSLRARRLCNRRYRSRAGALSLCKVERFQFI